MRRAKGALRDEGGLGVEDAGDGVDLGGLQRFFEAEGREDGGQALGEHGLAGTGRTDHEDVVTAGCGHFEGALGGMLAAHVGEIQRVMLQLTEHLFGFDMEGRDVNAAIACGVEQLAHFVQRFYRVDVHAFDYGGFAGVGFGHNQIFDAVFAGSNSYGEHSGDGAQGSVEAQLANQDELAEVAQLQGSVSAEDADGHGEIEAGAFLLDVGWCEVDGDVRGRDVEAGVFDSGADAVAALAHGGVGKADGVEVILVGLDAREVHLDIDHVGVDAVDGRAEGFEMHKVLWSEVAGVYTRELQTPTLKSRGTARFG